MILASILRDENAEFQTKDGIDNSCFSFRISLSLNFKMALERSVKDKNAMFQKFAVDESNVELFSL